MASRRMVSVKIIDSAKFIKMPVSTQALYFHLLSRADDDGIVEAFNIMRMTGASEDDLKVLTAKGFARILNEDLVTYITDWHEHNLIRADRKIDSIYQNLLLEVVGDVDIKQKKERADRRKLLEIGTSQGQPKDGIGKVSLGKGSSGKVSKSNDKEYKRFTPPTLEEVTSYCVERDNNVDPQRFIDYNESRGWVVGKTKMKNWKSAVHTWERNDKQRQVQEQQRKVVEF
jgi:hypothetical protein